MRNDKDALLRQRVFVVPAGHSETFPERARYAAMCRAAMTVYLATKNAGKVLELQSLLGSTPWRLERFAGYRDVVEGDASYAANAALKARALRAQLGVADVAAGVLGDDSGLEVAALGGRPGIFSARYGGSDLSWAQRRAMLLAEAAAADPSDRRARFVCALHYISADGREYAAASDVRGTLVAPERGDAGFSYDAIFARDGDPRTFAEMTSTEKNAISHRFGAVAALLEAVRMDSRNVGASGCSSAW